MDWIDHSWTRRILDVAFPRFCLICGGDPGADRGYLCAACEGGLEYLRGAACPRCGQELGPDPAEGAPCPDCAGTRPAFAGGTAVCRYEGRARELVLRLKFVRETVLAEELGRLLAGRVRAAPWAGGLDEILPVPMTRRKERTRGHDPAARLAEAVARRLGLADAPRRLAKSRETPPQSTLSEPERKANVRDSFIVQGPGRIRGANLLLVDDVMTTGATLAECAKTLKRAGARKVFVGVFAR